MHSLSYRCRTKAFVDYSNLLDILPANSPLLPEIQHSVRKLKPRKEAAQSAEMGEMLDKLKGLGNNILGIFVSNFVLGVSNISNLGNFGLSTDNFKFEPNGQGGYSMNFVR